MSKKFGVILDLLGELEVTENGKKRIVKPGESDYDFMTYVWALGASVTSIDYWDEIKHSFIESDANELMECLQFSKKNVEAIAQDLRNGIYS